MAKQLPPSFLTQSSLEDHPIFEWLEKNSRKILFIILGLILALGLIYRYAANKNTQAERDYFQASNAITSINTSGKEESSIRELQSILKRHPELNAKYDGILAQNLLIANRVDLAHDYASQNFQRIDKEISPLYLSYAKNSLLVSQEDQKQALSNALALKEEMLKIVQEEGKREFGSSLYLMNLIRIAMLQHQLKEKDAEEKSWEELLQISNLAHPLKFAPAEVEKVLSHLDDQGVSLMDFIQANTSFSAKKNAI
ncbi:Uncharacterized protein PHSC3_001503 [Chlamydiales bacterium STE3]|nr:Uncharacterized protein PHSC3_001503 [Chlamydiales bacterium STE3]